MRSFIPISALAVALAAGAAFAGDKERDSGSTAQFEALDRNSDQRLSQSEASSDEQVAGRFAALDIDGDGYITKREYSARLQQDDRNNAMERSQSRPTPDQPRDPYR
jgi:hypothetical protein